MTSTSPFCIVSPPNTLGSPLTCQLAYPCFCCQQFLGAFQACRGDRLDEGVPVVMDTSDAPTRTLKIPTHADFLAFYSTVPGKEFFFIVLSWIHNQAWEHSLLLVLQILLMQYCRRESLQYLRIMR